MKVQIINVLMVLGITTIASIGNSRAVNFSQCRDDVCKARVSANATFALSRVLTEWSGNRDINLLIVSLTEQIKETNSLDPLVETAAKATWLGIQLGEKTLVREAGAVLAELSPQGFASIVEKNSNVNISIDTRGSIIERLDNGVSRVEILQERIFQNFSSRLSVSELGQNTFDDYNSYMDRKIFGSLTEGDGYGRIYQVAPFVQKLLAERGYSARSCKSDFAYGVLSRSGGDALVGAGLGKLVGGTKGAVVGGVVGGTIGAAYGIVHEIDNFHDCKKKEEDDDKEEKEKAEKEEKAKAEKEEKEKAEKNKDSDEENKDSDEENDEEDDEKRLKRKKSSMTSEVNPNYNTEEGGYSPIAVIANYEKIKKRLNPIVNPGRTDFDNEVNLLSIIILGDKIIHGKGDVDRGNPDRRSDFGFGGSIMEIIEKRKQVMDPINPDFFNRARERGHNGNNF